MAKSSRSSTVKANRTQFRKSLSGPKETARAERLSARLQQIIATPKAKGAEGLDNVSASTVESGEQAKPKSVDAEAMDVDHSGSQSKSAGIKKKKTNSNRVQKKRRGKEQNQITFKQKGRKSR